MNIISTASPGTEIITQEIFMTHIEDSFTQAYEQVNLDRIAFKEYVVGTVDNYLKMSIDELAQANETQRVKILQDMRNVGARAIVAAAIKDPLTPEVISNLAKLGAIEAENKLLKEKVQLLEQRDAKLTRIESVDKALFDNGIWNPEMRMDFDIHMFTSATAPLPIKEEDDDAPLPIFVEKK